MAGEEGKREWEDGEKEEKEDEDGEMISPLKFVWETVCIFEVGCSIGELF